MKTFTALQLFVTNAAFSSQKQLCLQGLSDAAIDPPIRPVIRAFNQLPYCFTMQSCYGHFVVKGQKEIHNCAPLPRSAMPDRIAYRIAYIAFCLDNNQNGRDFLDKLQKLASTNPASIQLGCADWFWQQQVNSFVFQVEPERFKDQDRAVVSFKEALCLEKIRNTLYARLLALLRGTD